eukprot:CAMPEP_0116829982 /NCGR_PEP_ID=MMETSP0418-20121206/4513_1 /TAXON_ID=1158023 /ORGANISM="Astrosyne radiata, Strain 13vi08-1A" /LENGTH=268 /DNA_ID=CAMNT_0004459041 /DNA_START=492 /DNA_END=1296 /DNA_ORIENTATION=+
MAKCSRSSIVSILDAAFEAGLMVSADGHVLHMNSGAESLLEFALKNGEQMALTSFVAFEEEGAPVSWDKVQETLASSPDGSSASLTSICTKKSGETFDAEMRGSLTNVEDSCVNIFFFKPVDTESRFDHMTRYMSTLLNMLTAIIETALDPIFQINEDGVIQMINEAAVKTFGWSRDEFMGSNISMICGGEHGPKHAEYLKRYLQTGETKVMGKKRELPAKRKDGSEFPIELGLLQRYDPRKKFVGFVRDITEIKKKDRLSAGIIEAA